MKPIRLSALLCAALVAAATHPTVAQSSPQGRVEGRIQGAPTAQVTEIAMNPQAVQVLNLHPFRHLDIVLPYPAEWVNGGDDAVFTVVQKDNILSLAALDLSRVETSMSVRLKDPSRTLLSFLVRVDSTMPLVYKLLITDERQQTSRAIETEIASRLAAEFDSRVNALAEMMFQQMLIYSGSPREINRKAGEGGGNDRVELVVHSAQGVPGLNGGATQLHIRYTIHNRALVPISDGFFRLYIQREKASVFGRTQRSPLYDVRDVRTSEIVPPGSSVRGILILDMPSMDAQDALHLDMILRGGTRILSLERLLVGAPEPPMQAGL